MKTREISLRLESYTDSNEVRSRWDLTQMVNNIPKGIYDAFVYKSTPPNKFSEEYIPRWINYHTGIIGGMSFRVCEDYRMDIDCLAHRIDISCNSKTRFLQIMRKRRK